MGISEIPIQLTLLNNKSNPLAPENLEKSLEILNKIRLSFPQKTIWLYTGYEWEQLFYDDEFDIKCSICENQNRRAIILSCDVTVDGRYIDLQRDITLKRHGSSNQRVIDVRQSFQKGGIVLWTE